MVTSGVRPLDFAMGILRGLVPQRPYPVMTWLLCGAMVVVFFVVASRLGALYGAGLSIAPGMALEIYERFGVVPATLAYDGLGGYASFLTSLFVHTGPLHLLTNLAFLRLIGGVLEREGGSGSLLVLFVCAGVVGSAAHCWLYPVSHYALVGASGGVAGMVGAILLFPGGPYRLSVGMPWGPLRAEGPAWAFVGLWFGLQVLSFSVQMFGGGGNAVPYAPHVVGLAFGLAWGAAWRWLFSVGLERDGADAVEA